MLAKYSGTFQIQTNYRALPGPMPDGGCFLPNLNSYLSNRMIKSQIGFMSGYGMAVNIRSLIKEVKSVKPLMACLFIDFSSFYDNVDKETL
jgi:hypothetical protein